MCVYNALPGNTNLSLYTILPKTGLLLTQIMLLVSSGTPLSALNGLWDVPVGNNYVRLHTGQTPNWEALDKMNPTLRYLVVVCVLTTLTREFSIKLTQ